MKVHMEFPEPIITLQISSNEFLEMRDIYRHYSMYHRNMISESATQVFNILDEQAKRLGK